MWEPMAATHIAAHFARQNLKIRIKKIISKMGKRDSLIGETRHRWMGGKPSDF